MPLISKSTLPPQAIPEQEMYVKEFNGSVIVRALTLHDRLALAADKDTDGPNRLCAMLSLTVLDSGHQQVYTKEEWYAFASRYLDSAMTLWDTARNLSGMGDDQSGDIDPKKDDSAESGDSPSFLLFGSDAR